MFEVDREVLKIYRDYTYERANIYYQKEVLGNPGPWTDDPYLCKYKFTNIRRELDRQSKYLINSVLLDENTSIENKALHCALFRCINHEDGIKRMGINQDKPLDILNVDESIFDDILEYERSYDKEHPGGTKQSNAYFLSGARKVAYKTHPKFRNTNTGVLKYVWTHRDTIVKSVLEKESARKAVDILSNVPVIGGNFMRYQIWVDFTYIPGYHFHEDEYVLSGPGCNLGINWMLFGNAQVKPRKVPTKKSSVYVEDIWISSKYPNTNYEQFIYWFRDNLPRLMSEARLEWNPAEFQHFMPKDKRDWNAMQIENSFCELNKLMRLRHKIPMRHRYYK